MKISEIFYSVQGEGKNIGVPSVFVRLSLCNKTCSFCDSKYTWKTEKEMLVSEVIEKIKEYSCKHITFTGGEPLLQQGELIELMENLLIRVSMFYYFEIETNGTITPNPRLIELTDLFTVSPKFENFQYSSKFSDPELDKVVFKFVVDKPEDLNIIEHFLAQYNESYKEVFLMPQAITTEEHNTKLPWIIDFVKANNYRVTSRLQTLAYGQKRGV